MVSGHVTAGVWAHIALAYSSDLNLLTLFIDGISSSQALNVSAFVPNQASPLTIGYSTEGELAALKLGGFPGLAADIAYFDDVVPGWYLQV